MNISQTAVTPPQRRAPWMLVVTMLMVGLMAGGAEAAAYPSVSLNELVEAPKLVKVRGWYQSTSDTVALVRGTLTQGELILPVSGTVFDWRPQPGELVELWGRLERRGGALSLTFYNGRNLGEPRSPRPTPKFRAGEMLELWLNVAAGGNEPYPFMQGITEDRRAVLLPGYTGAGGVVCLSGRIGFLRTSQGRRVVLERAQPCSAL